MNRSNRRALGAVSGVVVGGALAATPAHAAPSAASAAQVQDFLAGQLATLTGATTLMVHGTDIAAARAAVDAAGMRADTGFERIGVVVASGTAAQIETARTQPGVTYLEGNTPIAFTQETSNTATRGAEAVAGLSGVDGSSLDGSGVSVAVIDSGIDPTHPYLQNPTAAAPSSPTSRASASTSPPPAPTAWSRFRTTWTPTRSPAAATACTSAASSPAGRRR